MSVSSVRLISRTFSLGLAGGGGETGLGNVVPPALFGRNIKLRPVPAKIPGNSDKIPSGDGATEGVATKGAIPDLAEVCLSLVS